MDKELISDIEVEHLKHLARIAISGEETARIKDELNKMLLHFARLQEVNTDGLSEMARPISLVNVLRSDQPEEGLTQNEALAVGVEVEEGFFKVPRVVD